jgi:hypothetical protein
VTEFEVAIAPDSSEIAVVAADGSLRRAPTGMAAMSVTLAPATIDGAFLGYDALGDRLFWRADTDEMGRPNALRAVARAGTSATTATVAWDVEAWWSVPTTDNVLYRGSDGVLRRIDP